MEDVLEVHAHPPDASRPLVCLDECTKQLTREVRTPVAAAPGRPAREDYEYERNGVAAIFCAVAPHMGWRRIEERERRTRVDCAHFLRARCDVDFAGAEKIVLVQDHLHTHRPASLSEAFAPAEAARIRARFEFHFTPKHGSWLNIAEIELSALTRGCLARRIPDRTALARELAAWERDRNLNTRSIRWQFTTATARTKLRKLYPSFEGSAEHSGADLFVNRTQPVGGHREKALTRHAFGIDHLQIRRPARAAITPWRRCRRRAPWRLRFQALQHQQQLRGIQLLALRTEEPPHERVDFFAQQFVFRARLAELRRRASEFFTQHWLPLRRRRRWRSALRKRTLSGYAFALRGLWHRVGFFLQKMRAHFSL